MSRINLRIITGLLIIIGLAAIVAAYYIYPLETLADQTAFVVTVVSLVVSFLAFIIATLTYTSIDSVDTVTRMEGNVLENEDYVISITDIFDKYNIQNPKEIEDAIFRDLHNRFKRESKTAVAFANNLQHFIDLIVIFPLLYKGGAEKKKNIERIEALLDQIIRRKNKLTEISRGNLNLIEETVKLIIAVMKYQQFTAIEKTDNTSALLSVRGSMLKNAVTKTVYYNYLGLFYNKKAMKLIREMLDIAEYDLLSIQSLRTLHKYPKESLDERNIELLSIYLDEALKSFCQAIKSSRSDMMWEGFIKYNQARTLYFYELFLGGKHAGRWEVVMDEAITARARLNIIINDPTSEQQSYLQEEFIDLEHVARLAKINIKLAANENIPGIKNTIIYNYPDYEGLLEIPVLKDPYHGQSEAIRNYQQMIIRELTKEV